MLEKYVVSTSFEPPIPELLMDEDLMRQVVLNLVRNATEAMPEGGAISIGSRVKDDEVLLFVRDSGPGIADDVRERIFEAFYTTKNHGTGLGMALCYQIIQDHHGRVEITNVEPTAHEPGGAMVTVVLPIGTEESPHERV
ncbi:sensor histidine kinase, partial [Myxococcota bacterium]|nr:sensor histidine kinase [Myxococcota bacterium]